MDAIEITLDIAQIPDKIILNVPHSLGRDRYIFAIKSTKREFDD